MLKRIHTKGSYGLERISKQTSHIATNIRKLIVYGAIRLSMSEDFYSVNRLGFVVQFSTHRRELCISVTLTALRMYYAIISRIYISIKASLIPVIAGSSSFLLLSRKSA